MDEPFYSTVSPSTYFLAQNASKYVKGVLTGDGSDELVFGYKSQIAIISWTPRGKNLAHGWSRRIYP